MKKLSLIVVLVALALSACSQYQTPEAKPLTTNELRNIIIKSPKFDVAKLIIEENNLTLNWENALANNTNNLYTLGIPTQTPEYSFVAYYDPNNKVVLGIDITQTHFNPNNSIEVGIVDLNSRYLAKYTYDKFGTTLSKVYGKIDKITNLDTLFVKYDYIDKSQLYGENLIHTLGTCSADEQAVQSARAAVRQDRWDVAGAYAIWLGTLGLASAECYTAGVWTGGLACYAALGVIAGASEQLASARRTLDNDLQALKDALDSLASCRGNHKSGGGW